MMDTGSYRLFSDAGYECEIDEKQPLFDLDYPMTTPRLRRLVAEHRPGRSSAMIDSGQRD